MNKVIKILLSVMMVSFCALIIPLERYRKNIEIETATVKLVTIKHTENNVNELVGEAPISINFEIDTTIEEMNQKMAEIESIENKEEWFIAYKNIIDKYSYIIDSPETIYDYFAEEELNLLFRVVQAEVGDEYSFEQKVNVAVVIFNRLNHERFPDSLLEILTPDQFSPIASGRCETVKVSDTTILACEYAFLIGSDIAEECLFFDSNGKLKYEYVDNDGAHNFYKLKEIE